MGSGVNLSLISVATINIIKNRKFNSVFRVPQNDIEMAIKRVHQKSMNVTVTNLSKTKQIKP